MKKKNKQAMLITENQINNYLNIKIQLKGE